MRKIIVHNTQSAGYKGFGVATVINQLVQSQKAYGLDARIFSHDSEINNFENNSSMQIFKDVFNSGFSLEFIKYLITLDSKEMIFHQHGIWTGASLHAIVTNFRGTKVLISPHGALDKWALDKSKFKKRLALLTYEGLNLNKASVIHALTPQEFHSIRTILPNATIAIIPNGVFLPSSLNPSSVIDWSFSFPKGKINILYLSRVTAKKGLHLLVDALSLLKTDSWHLTIAGPTDQPYFEFLSEKIRNSGLSNQISFIGLVAGLKKDYLYSKCDFFILPSLSEGMPMVVLEALSFGKPVLTTLAASIPEIESHRIGFIADVTVQSIYENLNRMFQFIAEDPDKTSKRCLNIIKKYYLWDSIAIKYAELYDWMYTNSRKPNFVKSQGESI